MLQKFWTYNLKCWSVQLNKIFEFEMLETHAKTEENCGPPILFNQANIISTEVFMGNLINRLIAEYIKNPLHLVYHHELGINLFLYS